MTGRAGVSPCRRTFIGTLGYMAPEMLREQRTSAKVDLFSYGVVLWCVSAVASLWGRGGGAAQ